MLQEMLVGLGDLLGLEKEDLTVWEMSLRAAIIYVTAIFFVKVGKKRFMGRNTAFDMVLGIILGSVLSRAITGNAPFAETVVAGGVLVALHWLLAFTSFHSDRIGSFIKGRERPLVHGGHVLWDNMRKSHLSRRDLEMAMRSNGGISDMGDIESAHFERNGDISIVAREKKRSMRVVEFEVKDGIQTVRLELRTE